jgi:hypothetical protein
MEWYWWVLIVVLLVVFAIIKMKFIGMWMEKRKANQERIQEDA